jgi:hypothetical protein
MDEKDPAKRLELLLKALHSLGNLAKEAASYPRRVVANYENRESGIFISTASIIDGFKPFETAVIHPRYNGGLWMIVEAYPDAAEAEKGHYRWVKLMTSDALPEVIVDAVNCVTAQCCVEAEGKLEYRLDDPTP